MSRTTDSQGLSFAQVSRAIRDGDADSIVDGVRLLSRPRYAAEVDRYLMDRAPADPKLTRAFIRAAGRNGSASLAATLAILLSRSLLDPTLEPYRYELIDALGQTGRREYASLVARFLESGFEEAVRSTAAHALGDIGTPAQVLDLWRAGGTPELRRVAEESLRLICGRMPDKQKSDEISKHVTSGIYFLSITRSTIVLKRKALREIADVSKLLKEMTVSPKRPMC